jgi:nucleoside-diphosphate-sugar epimerase
MSSDASTFVVLGSTGFIGSHLVAELRGRGASVWAPARDESMRNRSLGHVLYCIGLTGDFRARPLDAVDAHVGRLQRLLRECDFRSLLYLSSTRVYAGASRADEEAVLRVAVTSPDHLYNISKIMGESLCLASGRPNVRVVRLSNVYGVNLAATDFLSLVIRDALVRRRVALETALDSEKDYVDVRDVAKLLPEIARSGRHRVYNVARGQNTSHAALLEALRAATPCAVDVAEGAPTITFPPISVERVREEFGWTPRSVLDDLETLVTGHRHAMGG